MKIARYFDAAILKPDMTPEQVADAIKEAISFDSYTVCVRGCDIDLAVKMTEGTNTKVSCVLDFPYGYGGLEAKRADARAYAAKGVVDIDMVMNYGAARVGCGRGGDQGRGRRGTRQGRQCQGHFRNQPADRRAD